MKFDDSLVVRNTEFRRLWSSEVMYRLSSGLRGIAVPWLVLELTGSPFQLSLAFALGVAPSMLLAPFIGYPIDHSSRTRLMVGAVLSIGTLLAVIPILHATGRLETLHVYGVLVALSVADAVYANARESLMPVVVPEEELDRANSYFHGALAGLSVVFLGVGGVATDVVGATTTLSVAAVAGFVAAPFPYRISESPPEEPMAPLRDVLRDVRDDVARAAGVIRGTVVIDIILFGLVINLATVPFVFLITTISWNVFGMAVAYAGLLVAFRVGKLSGNYAVDLLPLTRGRKYALGIVGTGIATLVVAVTGVGVDGVLGDGPLLLVLGVLLAFVGFTEPIFNVPSDSIVQLAADDENRGMVLTLTNSALELPFPVALLGAGHLVSLYSPFAIFGMSAGILLTLGVVAFVHFDDVDYADDGLGVAG